MSGRQSQVIDHADGSKSVGAYASSAGGHTYFVIAAGDADEGPSPRALQGIKAGAPKLGKASKVFPAIAITLASDDELVNTTVHVVEDEPSIPLAPGDDAFILSITLDRRDVLRLYEDAW